MAGNSTTADLSIDAGELANAQSKLNEAANRLAPVLRGLQGVDTGVVGADPLMTALEEIQGALIVEITTMGEGVATLAKYIGTVVSTMNSTDLALGHSVGGRRVAE